MFDFVFIYFFICLQSLYTVSVPEDAGPGRSILQVSATDADIRSNAHITYQLLGPGAEHFSIVPDTGTNKNVSQTVSCLCLLLAAVFPLNEVGFAIG